MCYRKIFIGGLSYDTNDGTTLPPLCFNNKTFMNKNVYRVLESLRKYFSGYGSIEDSVVMKDPASKRSRGFGFITFNNTLSVDNAVRDDPHTIDGRRVSSIE